MSCDANQCSKCKNFIIGTICYTCDVDLTKLPTMPEEFTDLFGDIFKNESEKK